MNSNFAPTCQARSLQPPASESEVATLEEKLRRALPTDYRKFLLEWNGVAFDRQAGFAYGAAYPAQSADCHTLSPPQWSEWVSERRSSIDDRIGSVSWLYGVADWIESDYQLGQAYEFHVWTPERFLPIGELADEIGRLCISCSGQDKGHVYEWVKPEDYPRLGDNCSNLDFMWWVAPSFTAFWQSLRQISEDEHRRWQLWTS